MVESIFIFLFFLCFYKKNTHAKTHKQQNPEICQRITAQLYNDPVPNKIIFIPSACSFIYYTQQVPNIINVTWWRLTFPIFWTMFYTYLNASQYANTLFSFALFSCLKNALFLQSTLVLSFCGDVILTFSTKKQYKDTQARTQTHSKTDKNLSMYCSSVA